MGYSPGEDLDFSYRISRHGMLASVPGAHVHHYESSSGRTDRYRVAVLNAMNMAMLLRKNAVDLKNCKRKFWVLTARKILAELLKDGFSRRWTFPQLRGVLGSVTLCRAIFQMDKDELEPAIRSNADKSPSGESELYRPHRGEIRKLKRGDGRRCDGAGVA